MFFGVLVCLHLDVHVCKCNSLPLHLSVSQSTCGIFQNMSDVRWGRGPWHSDKAGQIEGGGWKMLNFARRPLWMVPKNIYEYHTQ